MNPLGYLFGVLITDGSILVYNFTGRRYDGSGRVSLDADGNPRTRTYTQHRIVLQCKDLAFAERFRNALAEVAGRTPPIHAFSRTMPRTTLKGMRTDYVFHGFIVKMACKPIFDAIQPLRRAVESGNWAEVMSRPDDFLSAALNGVADSDGYAHPNGSFVISQKDPGFILALCKRLAIDARWYSYSHQTVTNIVIRKSLTHHVDTYKSLRQSNLLSIPACS